MSFARGQTMLLSLLGAIAIMLLGAPVANALPSYARQTGQECAACHNGFPELTPYGRLFKLNGFTFGGGQSNLPPVAAMVISSYTKTRADQPGGAGLHFGPNNNIAALQSTSVFYAGAITSNLGSFIQGTYDQVGHKFTWDNTDIRYAGTTQFLGKENIFGVTVNNNPTVTDVWNSTPAWGYPFLSSELAPTPSTKTTIEGGFAQQVIGPTVYNFWNRLLYTEIGFYSTLTKGVDSALGVNPSGTNAIKGLAPYWRVAVEPKWGANSLELGTFGLAATIIPGRVTGFGTDHVVDVGFDAQYQFLGERDSFSVQASFINENQSLTASQAIGNSANGHNRLQSLHVKASYYYEQTVGVTAGYFQIQGNADPLLFGGISPANNIPNSDGWIGELNYLPFNHGGPSFWPWLNVKLGLQYIYYDKFDGGRTNFDGNGRNAHDNNTIFAFAWLAF
jgi:hypothetical protein